MFAEKPDQIPMADALGRLHALFADEAVLKVGHNLKYDIGVHAQHGLRIAPYDDTLVMSFALDAGKHQHGLDELAKLHLDHVCLTFKEMCGTGKSQISFAEVPLDRATEYAAEDAEVAWRSEEHTSELQSLMRISYAVFCLKKTTYNKITN